jgi:hypothetical protein
MHGLYCELRSQVQQERERIPNDLKKLFKYFNNVGVILSFILIKISMCNTMCLCLDLCIFPYQ